MIVCDNRPGHPLDRTVRTDRQPRPRTRPARPGHPKKLSDAELICLAVAQVLLGARSEHHWLRMCYGRLGHLFPYLPKQPGYHKRVKAAAPLICQTTLYLATLCPSWASDLRLLDATPVPCGTSRQTVRRSELAGWANYGYCAAHSRWYWGLKLYLLATAEGMPVAWCLADPKLGERDVAQELLGHARDTGALREQMIVLAEGPGRAGDGTLRRGRGQGAAGPAGSQGRTAPFWEPRRDAAVDRSRPPLAPVKSRCFLTVVFLVSRRVPVPVVAVPSGRGCRSRAGVPCAGVAGASARRRR